MSCVLCGAARDRFLITSGVGGRLIGDASPLVDGHVLAVSSSHAPSVADMPGFERAALLRLIARAEAIVSTARRHVVAIEHGRSPTCLDPGGGVHAHVHVLPLDRDAVLAAAGKATFLEQVLEPPSNGAHLAVYGPRRTRYFAVTRPVPHLARTIAAFAAQEMGISWLPFSSASPALAVASTKRLRLLAERQRSDRHRPEPPSAARPIQIVITGESGTGKSSLASALSRAHGVPVLEVGVILRLLSLEVQERRMTTARACDWLWSSWRSGRIDFVPQLFDLAGAAPRLDGRIHHEQLWTGVEAKRLGELARADAMHQVLDEIAERALAQGAIVVGRAAGADAVDLHVHLSASTNARVRRKTAQLQRAGIRAEAHDWFTPNRPNEIYAAPGAIRVDTTMLTIAQTVQAAESRPRLNDLSC